MAANVEITMKNLERNIEIIDDKMAEVLRNKTPQERLAIAFNMWESAKKQIESHLITMHPEWTEKEIRREVIKRLSHGNA